MNQFTFSKITINYYDIRTLGILKQQQQADDNMYYVW